MSKKKHNREMVLRMLSITKDKTNHVSPFPQDMDVRVNYCFNPPSTIPKFRRTWPGSISKSNGSKK